MRNTTLSLSIVILCALLLIATSAYKYRPILKSPLTGIERSWLSEELSTGSQAGQILTNILMKSLPKSLSRPTFFLHALTIIAIVLLLWWHSQNYVLSIGAGLLWALCPIHTKALSDVRFTGEIAATLMVILFLSLVIWGFVRFSWPIGLLSLVPLALATMFYWRAAIAILLIFVVEGIYRRGEASESIRYYLFMAVTLAVIGYGVYHLITGGEVVKVRTAWKAYYFVQDSLLLLVKVPFFEAVSWIAALWGFEGELLFLTLIFQSQPLVGAIVGIFAVILLATLKFHLTPVDLERLANVAFFVTILFPLAYIDKRYVIGFEGDWYYLLSIGLVMVLAIIIASIFATLRQSHPRQTIAIISALGIIYIVVSLIPLDLGGIPIPLYDQTTMRRLHGSPYQTQINVLLPERYEGRGMIWNYSIFHARLDVIWKDDHIAGTDGALPIVIKSTH